MNTDQPYKLTTKELESHFDLNTYDFGARQFDMTIGRWQNSDPMSEKFYNLSPYNYCGNNPVKYIDLNGMVFTESSEPYVKKYEDAIISRIDKNNKAIQDKQATLKGDLKERKINRLTRQINNLQSENTQLSQAQDEVNTLRASDQMYDVSINTSRNSSSSLGNTTTLATVFDAKTGTVRAELGDESLQMIAHEFKHLYQFETGEMSAGNLIRGSSLPYLFYDKTDEVEAYQRGSLFGGRTYSLSYLPSIYSNFPDGPYDFRNYPNLKDFANNPEQLQKVADKYGAAFRINGNTYYKKD